MSGNNISPAIFSLIANWTREGYGWEDVYVKLLRRSYIKRSDKDAVRCICKTHWRAAKPVARKKIAP